jgi:hypothetical protein
MMIANCNDIGQLCGLMVVLCHAMRRGDIAEAQATLKHAQAFVRRPE